MNKYIFSFSNGAVILVESETKVKAMSLIMNEHSRLVESESFECKEATICIDSEGKRISD